MKDLDISVFVSVFREMLGPALWVLLAVATLGVLAFLFLMFRDRGLSSRRLVQAELIGALGGIVALVVMWLVTHSDLSDIGGPIDWILVAVIWAAGAVGTAILAYVALSYASGNAAPRPVP